MKLKLNNSEVMTILTLIDEQFRSWDSEPLVQVTLRSILNKINDNIRDPANRCVDSFVVDIINTYKEE